MKSLKYGLALLFFPILFSFTAPVYANATDSTESSTEWIETNLFRLQCLYDSEYRGRRRVRGAQRPIFEMIIISMKHHLDRWPSGAIPTKLLEKLKKQWAEDLLPALRAFAAYTNPNANGVSGKDKDPLTAKETICLQLLTDALQKALKN